MAEHEALGERVRREPVGAVQTGARAFADRVQPGERRAPVEIGRDAAHRVVRSRRDRHEIAARIDARLAERRRDVWKAIRVDRAHVEMDRGPHRAGHRVRAQLVLYRERDLVARCELLDEPRSFAVQK